MTSFHPLTLSSFLGKPSIRNLDFWITRVYLPTVLVHGSLEEGDGDGYWNDLALADVIVDQRGVLGLPAHLVTQPLPPRAASRRPRDARSDCGPPSSCTGCPCLSQDLVKLAPTSKDKEDGWSLGRLLLRVLMSLGAGCIAL